MRGGEVGFPEVSIVALRHGIKVIFLVNPCYWKGSIFRDVRLYFLTVKSPPVVEKREGSAKGARSQRTRRCAMVAGRVYRELKADAM